ncbi:MAG TPA: hypothetical protein VEK34_15950 [Methylocella sp.]|nr:hypothetical protein [Methylocella sp.]
MGHKTCGAVLALLAGSLAASAQQAKTYGSPLDTLMSTRLWADVPEAKDFVRDSRPSPEGLDYEPLTGTDPERPKPRSKAEVQALQAELEQAAARNQNTAAKGLGNKKPATAKPPPETPR